jgi:hypothetical protein
MNIRELKEFIEDLPDDMEIWRYDSDNLLLELCDMKVTEVTVKNDKRWALWFDNEEWEYLNFR